MRFKESRYEIGDVVVVVPPYSGLQAHSIFTIKSILVEKRGDDDPEILYSVKESRWMVKECDVLRKANV